MNLDFYKLEALERELEELLPLHRIAFAASICERLLPNYNAFSREEGWGDPTVLRTALDEIWQILQSKPVDATRIRQLQGEIDDDVVPHSDYVKKSHYTAEAQEACSAIELTLAACLDPTPEQIIKVARRARNTIDDFITCEEETVDPSWSERPLEEVRAEIASHPLALREMTKQKEDLERLKEVETLDRDFLEWFRTSFDNGGRSLIDLS